jgi:hypothetical protein
MPRICRFACLAACLPVLALAACASSTPSVEPVPAVEIAPAPAGPITARRPLAPGMARAAKHATQNAACPEPPPLREGAPPLGPPMASGSSNLMSPHFSSGFGFYPVDGVPPAPRAQADSPLELTLAGPATRTASEPLSLRLTFKNRGSAPLVAMRPLDGSLEHWRAPMYDLYIRDEASGAAHRFAFTGGRCGNVNAIHDGDYVKLAPGEARSDVAENGWASYLQNAVIARPGQYTVWVVYSFCEFKQGGLPLGNDVVRPETHTGVHASNAIRVTVR